MALPNVTQATNRPDFRSLPEETHADLSDLDKTIASVVDEQMKKFLESSDKTLKILEETRKEVREVNELSLILDGLFKGACIGAIFCLAIDILKRIRS